MRGLNIGWEYLTGCCIATDPTNRDRAEWPPHPGRVFMAIAAAWFETGESEAEGNALRWLETLGDPEMHLPPQHSVFERFSVEVAVPPNDVLELWWKKEGKLSFGATKHDLAIGRKPTMRSFPSVWIGDAPCFLYWPHAAANEMGVHRAALERLCGKVTRIGHSSSLVRMWVADKLASPQLTETWVSDDGLPDLQARRVSEGTLDLLDRQFNRSGREEYGRLSDEIDALTARKKSIRGKGASQQKLAIDQEIETRRERRNAVDARDPMRPKLGLWTGYRRAGSEQLLPAPQSDFDSDLLILTQTAGPRLPLASTLAVTQALRGTVLSHCASNVPDWISGHQSNGEPLRDGNQHLACIALPDASYEYSDGHLLGMALVFPRSVKRPERGHALGRMLLDQQGGSKPIELKLGSIGVITLHKRDWTETRKALIPEIWTAHPVGATTWATVTPVVLDRFPKCDPVQEREAWHEEITGIIATACQRLGLPAPVSVDFGTTSWHRGCPRATSKRRPLRGHQALTGTSAAMGDGFPAYPAKGGSGARPQFHVFLRFAERVVGPVLLCAGRFQGYGLCKPLRGDANR
jgi:CRISPR-associated protein Csb2